MFSSTIIPTINRKSLSRAVQSVLDQEFGADEFEVIVVNDTGSPLPKMTWQASRRVRIIDTNCRERSVARNTGAAIARGKYLNFLDDDDILLPGALRAFWDLAQRKGDAIWLSGGYQLVDNSGEVIEKIYPENDGNNFAFLVAGEGVPLGSSFLDTRYFFIVGCFDPNMSVIEDRDLGRRFAMVGSICHTNQFVAQFRIGPVGSTTNWSIQIEGERSSRERALNLPGSFARLWNSAKTCIWHGESRRNYWHGRVSRAYMGSILWNLQHRNLASVFSRALAMLVFMNWRILSIDFWRGMMQIDPFLHMATLPIPSPTQDLEQDEDLAISKEHSIK
jgi:glycosyltransferase involved in cell wall biosynthesis